MNKKIIHLIESFEEQKNYWEEKLSGEIEPAKLHPDITGTGAYEKGEYPVEFTPEVRDAVYRVSKNNDLSLYVVQLAAFKVLLSKYTGKQDIIVASPMHAKDGEDYNEFITIRDTVDMEKTYLDVLMSVKSTVSEAYKNQHYPLQKIFETLGRDRQLYAAVIMRLDTIHKTADPVIESGANELALSIFRTPEGLGGRVTYNAKRFKEDTIRRFIQHYMRVLEWVLANSREKLTEMELMSPDEKHRVQHDFNDNKTEPPAKTTIHEIFEAQAAATPENDVLICGDQKVTYSELNEKANRLAAILKKKGVKPNTIVGMMMERSEDMLVGIMGILKAGGAYLPVDPEYPRERIGYMLEEAGVSILLTQAGIIEKQHYLSYHKFNRRKTPVNTCGRRPQIMDMDSLPYPDRSLIDYEKYSHYPGVAMVKNCITLQGSRGCPYQCAYCHKIWPKRLVVRSAENLLKELQIYYNVGIRKFAMVDDIFNLDAKNSRRFFELIIENDLKVQIFFPNGVRGDILTPDYIDLMVEAGTIEIGLALETASPRMQKLVKKNLNIRKLKENAQYICEKYPHVITKIFMMHGLPTETEEEAMMTLNFVKDLKWAHFPALHILKVFPDTDMYKLAVENGVSEEDIERSVDLAYHELPYTLPFAKSFTKRFQEEFFNGYFLSKERLLHVLPYQMRVYSEDELVKNYRSYLLGNIINFEDLLSAVGIDREELGDAQFPVETSIKIPGLNRKIKEHFPTQTKNEDALRVLLLDLSQIFSTEKDAFEDVQEAPLGLLYILTYLNERLGSKVTGKIAKSRMDFRNYGQLKALINDFRPDVIGIRTLSLSKGFFHKTTALIRQWGIEVPIVVGGPYGTSEYETILQDRNVDAAVLGEGEETFTELIEEIIKNGKKMPGDDVLNKIPGLATAPGSKAPGQEPAREVIMLDEYAEALQKESPRNPEPVNRTTDLAYTIFTSGTTGKPKGVLVEHKGVVNYTLWRHKAYGYTENDVTLQLLSYGFDGFVSNFYSSILSGGTLVMPPDDKKLDIDYITAAVKEHGVTNTSLVPELYEPLQDRADKETLKTLRFVVVAGEKASPRLITAGKEKNPSMLMINEYGPTEATVTAAAKIGLDAAETSIIGKPIANADIYILDKKHNTVPVGIPGEICIGGTGLARGYLNSPQLTHEKFVTINHDGRMEKKTIYKTGDQGRWRPDGNIQFLGRIDHQVKIRGHRIELDEIENQLMKYHGIKDAVVTAYGRTSGNTKNDETGNNENNGSSENKYLCAYLVSEDTIEETELKEHLAKHLPSYMLPTYYVPLEAIPLTPHGKVDTGALPEPEADDDTHTGPLDTVEKKLAAMWAEILGVEDVLIGQNSNFFTLGGHSLNGMKLITQIHKEYNRKLTMAELFTSPTLKELGEYVKGNVKEKKTGNYGTIEPAAVKETYPLSSAQKRQYILEQMVEDSTPYNITSIVYLEGDIDRERMETAFKRQVERHESLRTTFREENDQPVQRIHDHIDFQVEYHRLTGTGPEKEQEEKNIIENFVRPFDLSKPPLMRVGLIEVREKNEAQTQKHVLMIDMHHIITDGISMETYVKEFMKSYAGEELPPLTLQYKDYSEWQNAPGQKEAIRKQENYWLKQFEEEIPQLDLPMDNPRPKEQQYEGHTVNFEIDEEKSRALKELALTESTTFYMVMLTIYNIFLSRLGNRETIVVGTPVSGRTHPDLDEIIGMFVNTLALKNYPTAQKTIKEFLAEVKSRAIEAFENQDYPFEELVEKLDVNRDLSRNPLFDTLFAFQDMEIYEQQIPGVKISPYPHESGISKFDITLQALEMENRLQLTFEYNTSLYRKETIERFYRYFDRICTGVVENPGRKISELEIISPEEKHQLLYEFNATDQEYPKEETILTRFNEQVRKTPDNTALFSGTQGEKAGDARRLTYRELREKVTEAARNLRAKGVGPNAIVGIMAERSIEMVVGIFAILQAGAAYMPIDLENPQHRTKYMMADSGAEILLTAGVPAFEGDITQIEIENMQAESTESEDSDERDNPATTLGSLAYVIYTSGTTGTPKGVMVEHGSVVNLINWMQQSYPIDERDVLLQKTPYTFDVSVWELYWWTTRGASLYLLGQGEEKDPAAIAEAIGRNNVSTVSFVPTMLNAFQKHLEETPGQAESLTALRQVIASGEELKNHQVETFNRVFNKPGGPVLINLYGPTEATVDVTYYNLYRQPGGRDIEIPAGIPIGKPINNVRMYIVDSAMNPQPVGVTGELCIGGAALARGYLNNPELTAEKFVDIARQAKQTPAQRHITNADTLYKTGDQARWRPDGNIEYHGRMDDQVKIRGLRIELGEIETQLMKHEAINEAVVIATEMVLSAYYTSSKELTVTQLRAYLSATLPGYMIPSYIIQLEKIPLTPSGKTDRKALPAPGAIKTGIDYVAPRNPVEKKLTEMWAEILKGNAQLHDTIGIHDNFFEQGGHSLQATQLVSKIHREFDVKVPLSKIFKMPTIKRLAQYIRESAREVYASVEPAEKKQNYALSPAQKRLFILQQMEQDSVAYNMLAVYTLTGKPDFERLQKTFEQLIKRHESFRTSITIEGAEPRQTIRDDVEFKIENYEGEPEAVIETFVRPFDISRAPLLRAGLLGTGKEESLLMVDMHHIISDGMSLGILRQEFMKIYAGEELPPLRLQYKDISEWRNSDSEKQRVKRQEAYWLGQFEGEIPELNMPIDNPRQEIRDSEGDIRTIELGEQETRQLKQLALKEETTQYTVMLAVYNIFLSKITGREDIVVGTPEAGRRHADQESIVGMFVNTLALRNTPAAEKTFREFLAEVAENTQTAIENSDYQFEDLVEKLVEHRDTGRNPLFDVMFTYHDAPQAADLSAAQTGELTLTPYDYRTADVKFDLTQSVAETGGKQEVSFRYSTKLFKEETIKKFTGYYQKIISAITADPARRIADIEILSGAEKDEILSDAYDDLENE